VAAVARGNSARGFGSSSQRGKGMIGRTSSVAVCGGEVIFPDILRTFFIFWWTRQDQFAEEEEVVKVTGRVCGGEGIEEGS